MVRHIGSAAFKHLEHLCLEIGPRPVGSSSNHAAADYIRGVLQDCGLDVALQEFACPLWEERQTYLELDGEDLTRGEPAEPIVTANDFSPPCDVTAPTVALGTLVELEETHMTGRIGLLYGELTKGTGLGARRAVYVPEHHRHMIGLLEQKMPAALITIHSKVSSLERLIRDPSFTIPSATVPAEVGLALLQHTGRSLRLKIDSHQAPSQFANVLASRAGHRPERIVLLAHFDTTSNTPGAVDNASGVAVLLALAEAFSHSDLPVSLEWILVNGEENGGLGDAAYLREREDRLDQILAVINLDGVGQRVGANTITVMGASQPFQAQVRDLHRRYPGVVWAEPWYESDHGAFLWQGVPCVPFTSVGVANIGHLPADNVGWISPTKLNEVASLVTEVIEVLQDKSPRWCREQR
ncbi:MAG: M28 family peptidase [Anaerolineae bacterium]|jgi:aminopeptidase YwaD